MHIGLIGGIGVAATSVYYRRLTAAIASRGHVPDITIVHADAATLVQNTLADDRAAQARAFQTLLDRLAAAGADCAAITSIGGHFCFAETQEVSPLPLVSAVTPIDAWLAARGIRRVGLLGTEVVMRTALYGHLSHAEAVTLPHDTHALGHAYAELAIRGHANEPDFARFTEAGRRLVQEAGAEAVVLAGTDLGLVFDGIDPGYRVIDALDVHVAILADLATGAAALSDHAD
ncbi:MAG: aspartate/glutamate racemase family protein [Pseudomonadota bacterium]